jgi:two-component system, cell cycle sensor histidine kinase and response regulator CckA
MDRSLRLLIVEDSENDADLLVRHLSRGGYQVTFERVDTAPAMSSALAKHWDLVTSDYSMPSFSGTAALRLLRDMGSEAPFIFVSGQIGEDNAVAALKQGAQDYVMKGNLKRLLPAVERELRETERRRERRDLERQVQQLEKFEAIGRLAGGIAHDFNNVIGAVLGLAQMGLNEAPPGGRLRERFQKIHDQARHAAGLTAQLLAFARRQILQPRTVSWNDLISEATSLLQTAIGEQIELQTILSPTLLAISADPTQMQQVLMNLCLNARDAMPNGGRLLLKTYIAEPGEDSPNSPSGAPSHVVLQVSDTGTGMDQATLDRIFEPFFSTKAVGCGTGLGLATVYGIVKQHGGLINVASEPGQGTTFRIYLPATAVVSQAPEPPPAEKSQTGNAVILVAEDHEGLRDLAFEILTSVGYRVVLAKNGQDALNQYQRSPNDFHLVVLDVAMPLLNGLEAYAQMRSLNSNLPVVFTTGHTEESGGIKLAVQQGAGFLQKPYTPEALSRAVSTALRK